MEKEKKGKKQVKKSTPKAPHALSMIVVIVGIKKNEYFTDLLQDNGVNITLSTVGKGTFKNTTLSGIDGLDNNKMVIFGIVSEDRVKDILEILNEKFSTVKGGKGIAFSVPMSSVIGVSAYKFLLNKEK